MTPGISNSPKPAVTLAHLKGKEDKELDCHLAKVEKERVVADAEAFHQNIKGIVEPTSNIGRRYLATKYPGRYPQWSHLVEGKGGVEARATQKAQSLRPTRGSPSSNARSSRRGVGRTGTGLGRGRGSYGTTKHAQGSRAMSGGEQHPLDMPPGTSFMTSPKREGRSAQLSGRQQHFNASRESQGSRHHFPGPPLSRYNNRDQVSPTERAQGTEAPTAKTPPQLSGQFKTYEEWHADKVRQELKLKEESYAMLMEENERALHVDLPCDGESVSSHSISTEPRSERSGHLPQYPLLEPIKKAPSPAALSFGIPPMTAAKAPGMPSSTPALEPIKVPFVNKLGIQQLSPINYDSDPRETGELVPGLAAHSKFQAPDWRARGKTESRACLSDTGSEKSTPRKTSKVEISPDMTENIDDITAGWDRALLG